MSGPQFRRTSPQFRRTSPQFRPQVTGTQPSQWVGGRNYATILADPEFWLSLRISLIFAAVVVSLTLITGTLVGLLLNRLGPRMAAFVSTSALLAWATPAVSASVIFFWLFDPDGGIVDWTLSKMPHWLVGSTNWAGFNWTTAALPAYTLLTLLVVWQSFPFVAVTVLAGLKTIPAELHESARVDGAGPWRAFWKITYPLLKPIFLVLLLLSIIWDFGVFTQAYLITGALGNRDEYNLGIYAYAKAFQLPPNYGLAGALAVILTVVLLMITVGYVRVRTAGGDGVTGPRLARALRRIALNGCGAAVAAVTLLPIFWMISTAFKPRREIFSLTPHPLPAHPTLANFANVISGKVIGISYWTFFRNSLLVTVASVVLASLISLLAAVGVARFRFRFRTSYLIMLLIVQMLPQQALVIALFIDFRSVNLLDSLTGLIVVYTSFALPISIWMLRNFVATVPRELEEAAAIDGAGPARIFWRILFPLVAPGLVATSVFSFIFAWNEFIFALTFLGLDQPKFTLPLYVNYFFGRGGAAWGSIMAASITYTLPPVVFFLLVRRRMRGGLVAGAVKG